MTNKMTNKETAPMVAIPVQTGVTDNPDVFITRGVLLARQMADDARKRRKMIVLLGDTGYGKTTALMNQSGDPNTFYLQFATSMNPKRFFMEMLMVMGHPYEGPVYSLLDKIVEVLGGLDKPLLIIDEAGLMTHRQMLYLKDLWERIKGCCGILFGGMPYFETNLLKAADKQKQGCAEFLRRIDTWEEIGGLNESEMVQICKEHGVCSNDVKNACIEYYTIIEKKKNKKIEEKKNKGKKDSRKGTKRINVLKEVETVIDIDPDKILEQFSTLIAMIDYLKIGD